MKNGTAVLRNNWFTNGELIKSGTPISELKDKPEWHMIVYVDENMNIIGEEQDPNQKKQEKTKQEGQK